MKAFISYSHKDEHYFKKLVAALAQMRRQGLMQEWTDNQIEAGDDFNQAISNELSSSELFIALLSADYLHSNYCYEKEFEKAQELAISQQLKIIPIICRPCDWKHTPFTDLKALPKDGKAISEWHNEDSAFFDVTEMLRTIIQQPLKQEVRTENIEGRHKDPVASVSHKEKKFKPAWLMGAFAFLVLIAFLFFQNSWNQDKVTKQIKDTTGKLQGENPPAYQVPKIDSGQKHGDNNILAKASKKQEGTGEHINKSDIVNQGNDIDKSNVSEKNIQNKFANDSSSITKSVETKLPSYSLQYNGGSKIKYYSTDRSNDSPAGQLDYTTELTTVYVPSGTNYEKIKFSFKDPQNSSSIVYGWINIKYLQKK